MSTHQKLSIQHQLASILNLSPTDDEDYISEILDQLLSIESADDVVEYLSNFVTDESACDVSSFVEDLGRFKSGEAPAVVVKDDSMKTLEEPPGFESAVTSSRILDEGAAQREEIRLRELEARERQREEQERLRLKKAEEEERRRREHDKISQDSILQSAKKSQTNDKSGAVGPIETQPASKQKDAVIPSTQAYAPKTTDQSKKSNALPSQPLKGKPKTICGCFGNKHPPLTNCLHCGRISCEREGYDYCPFCNHLITQFIPSGSSKIDSALAHKERLLEYDRTSASRTHVHDDQMDYFVTQSSMWCSEQEQEDAGRMEEERRKKLHQKGNQVLDIKF